MLSVSLKAKKITFFGQLAKQIRVPRILYYIRYRNKIRFIQP